MFRIFSLLIFAWFVFFFGKSIEGHDTTVTNAIKCACCEIESLASFDPIYNGSAIIDRRKKDKSLRHGRLSR